MVQPCLDIFNTMNNYIRSIITFFLAVMFFACEKPETPPIDPQEPENGFVEAVPDTVTFINSQVIYYGGEGRDEMSDCWVIKLYTDMELDMVGNPIGPGAVAQLLLNVKYNESQDADPDFLKGVYREMANSGSIAPGTFVSGYMTTLDLPGMTIDLADGTFYADVPSGSTTMDYDLIDEGALKISKGEDGQYHIEGVMVGKKYTKRYFKWSGEIDPRVNVPEEIPNSTLTSDLEDISFTQSQLQDKKDYFYLMDESYRCLLLYLADPSVDMSASRPAGDGAVLRLEVLVPWDVDIYEDGLPEGTYTMTERNLDTSIDKDNIVPGAAVPGLPNVFEAWKVSGSWYYELKEGVWGETYARIDKGTITVTKDESGDPVVIYDLLDCQDFPRKITGQTSLKNMQVGTNKPKPEKPVLEENTYIVDDVLGHFGSVALSNIGDYVCIAASPTEGVSDFDAIFEQDEYFYVAISPLLNGKEFDMKSEQKVFTVMSTLEGAYLESVAPDLTDEITSGKCTFNYTDGVAAVDVSLVLADGSELSVKLSAEDQGIVVNENIFAIDGNEKPIRTAFRQLEDGNVALYLTPAGISFFEDLQIATYYAYIILDDTQCNGRALTPSDIVAVGYVDNFNELIVDSNEVGAIGTIKVLADPDNPAHYVVSADVDLAGSTLKLRYDGLTLDASVVEVVESEVIYKGKSLAIKDVVLDRQPNAEGVCHVLIQTERDDVITISLPTKFLDGNAHGFSQSPDLYIEYDGSVYSKATGSSGTVTIGVKDGIMKLEATNYNNLEIIYEGPYEEVI